jgi:hypothetical protein
MINLIKVENYDDFAKEKEIDKLRQTDPVTIIEYIKTSIDILVNMKVQEKIEENEKKKINLMSTFEFEESSVEYEKLLRKLESDIRSYIKVKYN